MLIDGQLSYLMSSIFSYHVTISSHLLLLAIINFYHDRNKHFVLFSALILAIDNVVIPNKTAADSPTTSNKNKIII